MSTQIKLFFTFSSHKIGFFSKLIYKNIFIFRHLFYFINAITSSTICSFVK